MSVALAKTYIEIMIFALGMTILTSCSTLSDASHDDGDSGSVFPLEAVWEKALNKWSASEILALPDGGFVLAGGILRDDRREEDVLIARFSEGGDLIWKRQYNIDDDNRFWKNPIGSSSTGAMEYMRSIVRLEDGGFIVAGGSGHPGYTPKAWLLRLDANGEKVWLNPYGGVASDANAVVVLADGSFIVAGRTLTEYPSASDWDAWLARIDNDGEVVWERTYDGDIGADSYAVSALSILPNDYLAAALRMEIETEPHRLMLIDNDGRAVSQDTLDAPADNAIKDLQPAPGGGFIIAWRSYFQAPSVSRIGSSGDMIWETTFPDEEPFGFSLEGLTLLPNDQIVLSVDGYKNKETGNSSAALIFLDAAGKLRNTHSFEADHNGANDFEIMSDGSYISVGRKTLKKESPEEEGRTGLWIQKLSSTRP